jgi:DNA-binding transcriptional LysR family regulator
MTLQQLKYAVAVATEGTISAAAKKLFISQPSLTDAIAELEREMGITIFLRTNRGVVVSREGDEFLGYARQVLLQTHLLEERYDVRRPHEKVFSVSTQHYHFAVEAFSLLIRQYGGQQYNFTLRETTTYEIMEDVSLLRSEIGILCLTEQNAPVMERLFREKKLRFTELIRQDAHVFLHKSHPLAQRPFLTHEELLPYPCFTFEQGSHNAFFFSEDVLSANAPPRHVLVRERSTAMELMRELDGYQIGTGISTGMGNFSEEEYKTVDLRPAVSVRIGYLRHENLSTNPLTEAYLSAIQLRLHPSDLI